MQLLVPQSVDKQNKKIKKLRKFVKDIHVYKYPMSSTKLCPYYACRVQNRSGSTFYVCRVYNRSSSTFYVCRVQNRSGLEYPFHCVKRYKRHVPSFNHSGGNVGIIESIDRHFVMEFGQIGPDVPLLVQNFWFLPPMSDNLDRRRVSTLLVPTPVRTQSH